MAQYLKQEVRDDIVRAALNIFARDGYANAKISEIANEAGISTGNIYNYYKNKDDLFYSVIDERFAASFLRVLRKRVRTLRAKREKGKREESPQRAAEELLEFWIEHRLKVVVILARAQGSKYEGYAAKVVHELARLTLSHFEIDGGVTPERDQNFILERIFENTVTTIVAILLHSSDEATIRSRFQSFWHFQLAGLRGLMDAAKTPHLES